MVNLRGRCVATSATTMMMNGVNHRSGNCGSPSGPSHHADLPILRPVTAIVAWQKSSPTQLIVARMRHVRFEVPTFTEAEASTFTESRVVRKTFRIRGSGRS